MGIKFTHARACCLAGLGIVFTSAVQGQVLAQSIRGSITSQEIGDTGCYLTLRSDTGSVTTQIADFELCTRHPKLPGKNVERKRRPNPVLTPQTLSLSRRSFTADKSKCPGSKSSPHHARMAWCSGWSGSRMASRKSA